MKKLSELYRKYVVRLDNGACMGRIGDLEIDEINGRIESVVIPGRLRLFGLLGKEADEVIPWCFIKKIGEDVILVKIDAVR